MIAMKPISIGVRHGEEKHRTWFSPEFLEIGIVHAPICTWKVEGIKVTMTDPDGIRPTRIWMLTDEYDHQGHRLGVWPD